MKRVAEPLEKMGAHFSLKDGNFAPLTVEGAPLIGIQYSLKVASAQIKTAIILAALSAQGTSEISGEIHSRDHTERLLSHFGVELQSGSQSVKIPGQQTLRAACLQVPGDPSTAAFWMAAACLIPGAEIELENISLNPTRIGFLRVLQRMGAHIEIEETQSKPEPVGKIRVKASQLKGVKIGREEIPSLIDEVPLFAVVASQAQGLSEVEGAEELRVKESDRLEAVTTNLRAMGATLESRKDGFAIQGRQQLRGCEIQSFHDHRIAMAFSIAGLVASGETGILDAECVAISYPDFFTTLRELTCRA